MATAGVLYFLALLAHLVEWSSLRHVADESVVAGPPAPASSPATRGGGVAVAGGDATPDAGAAGTAPDRTRRTAMFGRLGVLLTVAVAVHFVALVGGAAADPNRVPWGNMYEFTITGTFVVALGYVVLLPPLRAGAGWRRSWSPSWCPC